MITLKQVNLEDKGSLVNPGEAIRTMYSDRYDEICRPLER